MAKFSKELEFDCLRVSTECTIDASGYEKFPGRPTIWKCERADWDTGATVTVISERLVAELGLIPIGRTKISGYNGRPKVTNEYRVDLLFPNDVRVPFVKVVEAPLVLMDLLVGMNVINQGHLDINFCDSKREFSFEI